MFGIASIFSILSWKLHMINNGKLTAQKPGVLLYMSCSYRSCELPLAPGWSAARISDVAAPHIPYWNQKPSSLLTLLPSHPFNYPSVHLIVTTLFFCSPGVISATALVSGLLVSQPLWPEAAAYTWLLLHLAFVLETNHTMIDRYGTLAFPREWVTLILFRLSYFTPITFPPLGVWSTEKRGAQTNPFSIIVVVSVACCVCCLIWEDREWGMILPLPYRLVLRGEEEAVWRFPISKKAKIHRYTTILGITEPGATCSIWFTW